MSHDLEWTFNDRGAPQDVPNLRPRRPRGLSVCDAAHPVGYTCTRSPGHTGRHAAAGVKRIVAVWR